MSMRAAIILLFLISVIDCSSKFDNKFESISFPLRSDKNPRVVEEVNKKDVKSVEVIYEEEYPAEDILNYYRNYFKKLGFNSDRPIIFMNKSWWSYEDASGGETLYKLKRCEDWTDNKRIYIGLCMWYESKNHECSRIYDFVLMEDVGFKGGEKVECNLSNLNIVIQA
ncbi:MAG: hypothetical protein N2746_06030, partial [Deltaproteobacteria bacterium]|nr:hypothetical protein [Deltaproteobacteria bacterium]